MKKRGNFGNRHVGIFQEVFRKTDSFFQQIIIGSLSGFRFEKMNDVPDGKSQSLGYVLQSEALIKISVDIVFDFEDGNGKTGSAQALSGKI